MIIRPMIASLILAVVLLHGGQAFAQGVFPTPVPGQTVLPASKPPLFPPVDGAAPAASGPSPFPGTGAAPITGSEFERGPAPPSRPGAPPNECMKAFFPLREEAEKRGKLIKAASDRKAGGEEACKLMEDYRQSEIKMVKYVEANAAKCGIPQQIIDQMKNSHKITEARVRKVCAAARRPQWRGPPPVGPGDFWPAGPDKVLGDFPIIR